MADEPQKLTQQEIDALLEKLPHEAEAGVEAGVAAQAPTAEQQVQVQPYDFRGAVKLPKEQLWTLQMLHEDLAKRLTAFLSVYLRSKVQVTLSAMDQGTYADFIAELPMPSITYIVRLSPLPGRVILGMQADLAMAMIDRMLGGTGLGQAQSREPTDLEVGVLRKAVEKILAELAGAWESVIELEPAIDSVMTNPLFAGVAFPSDSAFIAALDVFLEDSSGAMSVLIPFSTLDPVARDLSSGMWGRRAPDAASGANKQLLRHMATHLAQVKVQLSVRLTTRQVNLEEIRDLRAGDILLLETRGDGLARVFIGGQHKGWGRLGTVGRQMAVEIEQVTESEPPGLAVLEGSQDEETTNDQRGALSLSKGPTRDDRDDSRSSSAPSTGPLRQAQGDALSSPSTPRQARDGAGSGRGSEEASEQRVGRSSDTEEPELIGEANEQ